MAEHTPGSAPVVDHRKPPRGVLPRGAQAWLMAGLALGLLAIIVITGRPTPAARPAPLSQGEPAAPNPDRLRDYQDRLRVLDERSRHRHRLTPSLRPRQFSMRTAVRHVSIRFSKKNGAGSTR